MLSAARVRAPRVVNLAKKPFITTCEQQIKYFSGLSRSPRPNTSIAALGKQRDISSKYAVSGSEMDTSALSYLSGVKNKVGWIFFF